MTSALRTNRDHLLSLPIPLFVLLILFVAWTNPAVSLDPRPVLPALNIVFVTGVSALVAWIAARSYLATGSTAVLFVGCGMLAFGVGSAVAAIAVSLRADPDVSVTVYNAGAFLAGASSLAAAVLVSNPNSRPDQLPVGATTLGVAVMTTIGILAAIAVGASSDAIPHFFVESQGPTAVRQALLGGTVAMFAMAGAMFWVLDRRAPSTFICYSFGLLLIAIGLGAVWMERSMASAISWVGRVAQYTGGVYLAAGVIVLRRERQSWGIPLDELLRETHIRYRVLVEMCPDAILVHSNGRYVFANAAAARLFGARAPEDLIGTDVLASIHPDWREFIAARIGRTQAGERSPLAHLQVLRHDGTVADVEGIGAAVVFQGKPAVQVVLRDITIRKRMEQELRDRADELDETNRLKDQFLATLSHELRTPLTAVIGWAQMLHAGQLDEAAKRRAVDSIYRNARAQQALIDDVLDVSRIVSGNLRFDARPVTVAGCLDAAVAAVRPAAAAKQIELVESADPDATVLGDAGRLQQVLWNLLSNAVKFTDRGGRVTATVRRVGADVEIRVQDSGIGIAPEALPHIFQRFWQADRNTTRRHGGLGLGLAIVRHLVELHGGHVAAESAGEGLGSTFVVRLPDRSAATPPASGATPENRVPLPADGLQPLAGLKVLIVDDQPDAREFAATALRMLGVQPLSVATAEDAMKAVREWRPDVLLSDIGMPDEDGYTLIRRIRALEPSAGGLTPAVAMTAYGRDEDRAAALAAGYNRHLTKPVVASDLAAAIAQVASSVTP